MRKPCLSTAVAEPAYFAEEEVNNGADGLNLLQVLQDQLHSLQNCVMQGFSRLEQTLQAKSLGPVRSIHAENRAISHEAGSRSADDVKRLFADLYFEREHRYPSHFSDRLLMLRKAYALLYGQIGKYSGPVSASNLFHGPELSMEEHGDFLRTEFDRLMDAFEEGLSDFRYFRESPTSCAVQRSTYVALLYVLARSTGCVSGDQWGEMLAEVRSFLREYADFHYPVQSPEAAKFRALISPSNLSRLEGWTDTALQRHAACGLILRWWLYTHGLIPREDFHFSLAEDFPRMLFWDGRAWTESMPLDLQEIAGPCASTPAPSWRSFTTRSRGSTVRAR